MINGIWKKISLVVLAIGLPFIAIHSFANAQDNFREFDRKMVATPAELFNALSTFQPPGQRKQTDGQRLQEFENAGRKFLSGLTPEQQEKAWEFAEKYLRKNGVDSTASQQLMKEFGLPPEMQNELSKQFQKYGNRLPNQNSPLEGNPDDGISELLRKARDDFQAESRRKEGTPDGVTQTDRQDLPKPDANVSGDQGNEREFNSNSNPSNPNPNGETLEPSNSEPGQQNAGEAKQNGQKIDSDSGDPFRQPNLNSNRDDQQIENPFDAPTPRASPKANRALGANQDNQPRSPGTNPKSTQGKTASDSDVDLDQTLERLGNLRKSTERGRRAGAGTGEKSPFGENLDWEKVISELAEEGTKGVGLGARSGTDGMLDAIERAQAESEDGEVGKSTPDDQVDQSLLNRAKDLISGSFDSDKTSDANDWGRKNPNNSASDEKLGTRFDRLLVKAAERTLTSGNDDQGVTKSVSSVFGSLIERIQEQATRKNDREQTASGNLADQDIDGGGRESDGDKSNDASEGNDIFSDGSNPDPGSQATPPSNPSMPDSNTSSFDPQKMLDSIPDLSSINPTQVFTFFAIVGLLLFAGYLLAQSLVGNEVTVGKRKVIKRIRNTNIQSPKALVETVDVFLLAKFGIKSSWWNAKIAKTVLKSGSPELQARVDDLMRDYVRARYMRDDIQIPAADQQRYKKTLEELSMLDISPEADLQKADLQIAAPSPDLGSPAPMEG